MCFVGASKVACHCRLICLLGFVCRSALLLVHRFRGGRSVFVGKGGMPQIKTLLFPLVVGKWAKKYIY